MSESDVFGTDPTVEDNTAKTPPTQEPAKDESKKGKKGIDITLLVKDEDGNINVHSKPHPGLRSDADVRRWMVENDVWGTVQPARLAKKPIVREKVTVEKFS